jgi:hypothetical protein
MSSTVVSCENDAFAIVFNLADELTFETETECIPKEERTESDIHKSPDRREQK